mmetsp:Transcript_85780/g.229453  ORF Transcript_85780/g.229453 Transcript_85780/m.229453 type:complete len:208 (+) Transcript_85780:725-1348(+)
MDSGTCSPHWSSGHAGASSCPTAKKRRSDHGHHLLDPGAGRGRAPHAPASFSHLHVFPGCPRTHCQSPAAHLHPTHVQRWVQSHAGIPPCDQEPLTHGAFFLQVERRYGLPDGLSAPARTLGARGARSLQLLPRHMKLPAPPPLHSHPSTSCPFPHTQPRAAQPARLSLAPAPRRRPPAVRWSAGSPTAPPGLRARYRDGKPPRLTG